jgi:hypothetical protein
MGRLFQTAKNRSTSDFRRAPRKVSRRASGVLSRALSSVQCEALEERQLMSLTIEVRDAGGGTSTTVTSVGQVVNLQVLAVVTDPNNTPSDDGLQDVGGDFQSTAVYGHAVAGNLAAANTSPFNSPVGANPGTKQDLNGDGNIDVGIPFSSSSTLGLFRARSSSLQTGSTGTGTISGNSLIFEIATLTYTVTSLNKGGQTSINFIPYLPPGGAADAAAWAEDISTAPHSGQKDNTTGTFQAGSAYTVSDPALITAPVANNTSATVTKNTATVINELAVDDIVAPLNDASVTVVSPASHGSTALQSDGSIKYTPAANYTGADSFTYTVADTGGRVSNQATVSINVVNAPPPVAGPVTVSALRNTPSTVNVLAKDSATAPATVVSSSVAVQTQPAHGTAVKQSDGSIVYTPATGYTGSDSFTYTVADSNSETSAPGTVTINVAVPAPPSVPVTTSQQAINGTTTNIDVFKLATLGSLPLDPTKTTVVTPPTEGSAIVQSDGSISFTPAPGYTGSDSFVYTVGDTQGEVSNQGTISLNVIVAPPPTANNATAPVLTGTANTIDVLAHATTAGPALLPADVKVVTQPTNGTATVNVSTGAISYTPVAGFIGTDSFTYTVEDASLDTSLPATITLNVGTSISNTKGATHSLSFTDAAGGLETISINSGTAQIFFSGTASLTTSGSKATVTGSALGLGSIQLSGTTRGSTLSIRGSAKTPATLGGISDASPLGGIVAPTVNITGDINLSSAGTLSLGSISNSSITIGAGAPGRIAITAGAVTNSTLSSAVPITSLRAASWTTTAADRITAPSIASLQISGAFNPSLTLTAGGKTPALSSARITGAVSGGSWNVSGGVGTVSAGSIAGTWSGVLGAVRSLTIKAGGLSSALSATTIGTLSIGGDLTGTINTTGAVQTVHVTGGMSNSSIGVATVMGSLIVGGAVSGSTISTGGSVRSISVGSITGSAVSIGGAQVSPSGIFTLNLAGASAASVGSSTLGSFRSGSFASTTVEVGSLSSASLGTITTDNSGTEFGIGTKKLGSFAGVFANGALHAGHGQLLNEEVLTAYFEQQGATLGDFSVQLLT